jgi:hypothetical protein
LKSYYAAKQWNNEIPSQQLDEEKIFHLARSMDDPAIRSEYLNQVCAGSLALRERVDAFLKLIFTRRLFLSVCPFGQRTDRLRAAQAWTAAWKSRLRVVFPPFPYERLQLPL